MPGFLVTEAADAFDAYGSLHLAFDLDCCRSFSPGATYLLTVLDVHITSTCVVRDDVTQRGSAMTMRLEASMRLTSQATLCRAGAAPSCEASPMAASGMGVGAAAPPRRRGRRVGVLRRLPDGARASRSRAPGGGTRRQRAAPPVRCGLGRGLSKLLGPRRVGGGSLATGKFLELFGTVGFFASVLQTASSRSRSSALA